MTVMATTAVSGSNTRSAPTAEDRIEALKASMAGLKIQRESLEAEGMAIISELTTSPGTTTDIDGNETLIPPAGIDTPVVDKEGYPRNDIDIYRVRTLRGRLATIRFDHKTIQRDLEQQLYQLAALNRNNASTSNEEDDDDDEKESAARRAIKPKPKMDPVTGKWVVANWDGTVAGIPGGDQRQFENLDNDVAMVVVDGALTTASAGIAEPSASSVPGVVTKRIPFARVNTVASESPAALAGLQPNDLIVQFGELQITEDVSGSGTSHTSSTTVFGQMAPMVPTAAATGRSIPVQVARQQRHAANMETQTEHPDDNDNVEIVTLQLFPKPWAGRGLLGCHLLPMEPEQS